MSKTIRVLLVDDSLIDLAVLKHMLGTSPEIEVVGTARSGREALRLIPQLDPKVICTDLQMPDLDGLQFTKAVMQQCPRPILVISSLVGSKDAWESFRLIEAGAIDVFPKPRDGLNDPKAAKALVDKIRILSGVFVFSKKEYSKQSAQRASFSDRPTTSVNDSTGVVVVGASTGGPQALYQVFTALPKTFPMPILCVQHISEGFIEGFVDWLNKQCQLSVKVMDEGEIAVPGTIYFPKEDTHLRLDGECRLFSSHEATPNGHRPSIDVLFHAAAAAFGSKALGALLTGMGQDGALGLKAIYDSGGITVAQDEATSVVFGMPRVAIEMGAVQKILSLDQIAPHILYVAHV